jgi:benzoyl-CoA reductase/2-hydroxyglutaryl-CoA dehydratase subunit BcrC/BadD/HgdB
MPGMADVTGNSFSASFVRTAFLAASRWKAVQSRTARAYLQLHAFSASLELFKPGAIVPWVSYLFPTEILSSYGITPMIPEIGSAVLTGSDLRDQVEAAAARLPLARDVCSYHRTALAAVENGDMLPVPTMCLGTTPLCLGKEMLLEMLATKHDVPFREIRVPLPPDEGQAAPRVVADVAEQIRALHEDIGRWTGRSPNLRKAVELSNRASKAWGEINAARLAGKLEMDGRKTFALVFLGQLLWGSEAGAKDFERLLTDRGRRDLMAPALEGGRRLKRLLWLHTVPHHDRDMFDLLEKRGAVVIFEEMGQMHLETIDPDDPFPGLARRLTDHALWGTSARRARLNLALAKQLKVDGVVHFNHWGCRHGLGSVPVVRSAFMEAGIPFLAIDGDALARGGPNQEKSLQQMESFLELL